MAKSVLFLAALGKDVLLCGGVFAPCRLCALLRSAAVLLQFELGELEHRFGIHSELVAVTFIATSHHPCLSPPFLPPSLTLSIQPSSGSRFFVLNDWQDTFSEDKNMAPLPAAKVSDIMLKSMGILRVCTLFRLSVTWGILLPLFRMALLGLECRWLISSTVPWLLPFS